MLGTSHGTPKVPSFCTGHGFSDLEQEMSAGEASQVIFHTKETFEVTKYFISLPQSVL